MKASSSTKDTGAGPEAIADTIIDGTAIAGSGIIADATATIAVSGIIADGTATIAAELFLNHHQFE
jgi:hypothetical protein